MLLETLCVLFMIPPTTVMAYNAFVMAIEDMSAFTITTCSSNSVSVSTESTRDAVERENSRLCLVKERSHLTIQDLAECFNDFLFQVSESDIGLSTNMAWLYRQGYFPQITVTSDVSFMRRKIDRLFGRKSTYVMYLVVDDEVVLEGRGKGKGAAFGDFRFGVSEMVTEAVLRIGEYDRD